MKRQRSLLLIVVALGFVAMIAPASGSSTSLPTEDLCKSFYLAGPNQVAAGKEFSVAVYPPAGFTGRLIVVGFNLDTPTFVQELRGEKRREAIEVTLMAPETGLSEEVWLPVAATLLDKSGCGVCTEIILVRDL